MKPADLAAPRGERPAAGATEWSLPGVIDAVTDAVPEREMLVWGQVRRTYAEVQARTRRLAAFLAGRGLGARHERPGLARWECGQARVALLLSNCPQYVEAMLGSFRARAVPYNVNHHYGPREVAALLEQIGADAVVYHRRLGRLLGPLLARDGGRTLLLLDVDDGSGVAPVDGSTPFETAIERAGGRDGDAADLPEPSPDDLYLVCTGGTTGSPKGVLWRQADVYMSAMGGVEAATRDTIRAAAGRGGVWFAAPPLMHAAAQWTAFAGLHGGARLVLHDDAEGFDARAILETIERERVNLVSIVGDAYARPLLEELRTRSYDLSSLASIGTGGAVTGEAVKQALTDLLPHVTVVEGYGASETGGMAFGTSRAGGAGGATTTRRLSMTTGGRVLSADRTRFLEPGQDEVGWVARTGRVPLGYLGDRDRTEATFPVVDGERVSVPGDRALLSADGTIVLLGRDSTVVNTGGEKVFVEEVEEVLRQHPDVVDALVVGRPSERFGEEVVALVQARAATHLTPGDVREFVARSVARFKAPRALLLCERIGRHPSGKPDYTWARRAARDATAVPPRAEPTEHEPDA